MPTKKQVKTKAPRGEVKQLKVKGGEIHQQCEASEVPLTTNQGLAISDNQNSVRAGERGPTLLAIRRR